MNDVIIKDFQSYPTTIPLVLRETNLASAIANQKQILIKPNLTLNLPPPITTPVELVEEVVKFCQQHSPAKIIIAEGSGGCDTSQSFQELGYETLAKKYNIKLIDLNKTERIEKENPTALKLKKVALPKIAFNSYIINIPVLKIHGAAKMTAAMKNVYGFYLNSSYLMRAGEWIVTHGLGKEWWNKSELHLFGVHETIIDLNSYIHFDFNLVDASVGQNENEVHGFPFNPPIGKIIAGNSAKEVDYACAPFLRLNPKKIKYLIGGEK